MIRTDPETPHRHSIRLNGWDYSGEGWYFVTVVAFRRESLFGELVDGRMNVNILGRVVEECWEAIHLHFPNTALDAFVVMPNHVHGIIVIHGPVVGATHGSPLPGSPLQKMPCTPHGPSSRSLGAIIGSFKSSVSRRAGKELNSANLWQRNYYEHIIRNDRELAAIRNYIALNPERWAEDKENPLIS